MTTPILAPIPDATHQTSSETLLGFIYEADDSEGRFTYVMASALNTPQHHELNFDEDHWGISPVQIPNETLTLREARIFANELQRLITATEYLTQQSASVSPLTVARTKAALSVAELADGIKANPAFIQRVESGDVVPTGTWLAVTFEYLATCIANRSTPEKNLAV